MRPDCGAWTTRTWIACSIGGRERREIVIADYDPAWPERFAAERERIAAALGERALRIEHIGSTAVPGPGRQADRRHPRRGRLARRRSTSSRAGYVLRVREEGHRMFRTPELDVHVHVWPTGSPNIAGDLAFRDRLRASPEDRAAYEALKRELATRDWPDMNHYADAKGPLIREILGRAGRGTAAGCGKVTLGVLEGTLNVTLGSREVLPCDVCAPLPSPPRAVDVGHGLRPRYQGSTSEARDAGSQASK